MPGSPTGIKGLLERGNLRLLGLLPRASNYTFLGEVSGEEGTALVVYKPRRGEAPLWDFPDGTLCRREVAAFVLSEALGWPSIPPTILREGPHGPGAVQLFIEADPNDHYFTLRETTLDEFRPVAAFDVLINNADRKSGHCLRAADGRIWLVDHGLSFSVQPKLRTVIWDFAGEPVPPDIRADLHRLLDDVCGGALGDNLRLMLDRFELDALRARAEHLLATGVLPEPDRDYHSYPWPTI